MMIPKKIAGHNGNAAALDFSEFGFPFIRIIAGKMEFAHDGQPRMPVKQQIPAVYLQPVARRGLAAQV